MANTKIDFNFHKLKHTIMKSEDAYAHKIMEYERKIDDLFRRKNFKGALELSVNILQQLDRDKVEDEILVKIFFKKDI